MQKASNVTDALQLAEQAREAFAARADAHDRAADFPADDMDTLRAAGLLGLMVPERLGGKGAGFADYVRVAAVLAQGSGASALVFNMHASITGTLASIPEDLARQLGAPDAFFDHRDTVLRAAADGALYGVAITEREAGSRLSAVQSTFERTPDGYRLRGEKSVCTGAGHLDAYLFPARAADAGPDEDPRISYFLVPGPLVTDVSDTWDPLGMRGTASNGFRLDADVPAEALLGGVEGLAVLLAYALPQWLVASYAAVYVGVAQAAIAEASTYLQRRVVTGRQGALTGLGFVRARLGRADADVAAARLALEHAGALVDATPGEPDTNRWIYRAKLLAGDAAMTAAASCAEACGLGALRRGSGLERIFRDARSGAIMPPSSDVCADVLGTAVLGLDPFSGSDIRPW